MTAANHALTGALIGLAVTNPVVAMPLAFLSHFACDVIPHYDMAAQNTGQRIGSKKFLYEYLIVPGTLCVLLVVILATTRPQHWLTAAICAFLAASPDLFWIPRFLYVRRTGTDQPLTNWFLKFHDGIQWKTGPKFIWVEAVWFVTLGTILLRNL